MGVARLHGSRTPTTLSQLQGVAVLPLTICGANQTWILLLRESRRGAGADGLQTAISLESKHVAPYTSDFIFCDAFGEISQGPKAS